MQIAYPDSNRIGQFRIMHEVLLDGREAPLLKALFSLCVILHTEQDETGRGLHYYAVSELFQPIPEGEIPEYRIECAWPDQAFKNPEHELGCLKAVGSGFRFKAIRQNIVRVPPASLSAHPRLPGRTH